MSVAKLLLSGFLVAGGLILGAFTLHRHFAPQREALAIALIEADVVARPADTAREPSRPTAGVIAPDKWTPRLVRAESEADAAAKAQKRQAAEKKAAEKRLAQKKPKEEEEEPQTVFPWLWSLIANNNGK